MEFIDGPSKRIKIGGNENIAIPSSVICEFVSQADGSRVGHPIDLPSSSTSKQLELLVNSLLQQTEKVFVALIHKD